MSELKCPFCQQELEVMRGLSPSVYGCPKCKHVATIGVWEALAVELSEHDLCHDALVERTKEQDRIRKALDKAKWWLNEIVENHRHTPISTAEMVLKELDNE